MPVLEARFHAEKSTGPFIVVGRVYCEGPRAVVIPAPEALEGLDMHTVGPMIEKLRYLVRESGPHPFETLRHLRSDFWSFIEVEADGAEASKGNPRM